MSLVDIIRSGRRIPEVNATPGLGNKEWMTDYACLEYYANYQYKDKQSGVCCANQCIIIPEKYLHMFVLSLVTQNPPE